MANRGEYLVPPIGIATAESRHLDESIRCAPALAQIDPDDKVR